MNIKKLLGALTVAALLITPLTVSADFGNEIKVLNDGTTYSRSGYSVAIDGDLAIAGRYTTLGRAQVLERDLAGDWSNPSDFYTTLTNDRFGFSVSISGDTAIVGASRGSDSFTNAGYAKIFVRDVTTGNWSEQAKLLASDPSANAVFGHSVAISGDTAIVGAYGVATSSGAAYVFVRDGAGAWTEQQKLVSSDIAPADNFGIAVAIDGDTAIVGARLDAGSLGSSGSTYIFVRNGGVWTQQQKLNAQNYTQYFGSAVAIDGDTAVVGTDSQSLSYIETVHVFVRNAGVWTEQQELGASDGAVGDEFGTSLSISGNTLVIGAPGYSSSEGSVYVFMRDTGVWTEQPKVRASDAATGDTFGQSVSISGDTLMVGSPNDDNTYTDTGSVYVYTATGGAVTAPDITVTDLTVAFGDVTELTSIEQTITITNAGNADLVLGTIVAPSAPFSLPIDNCSSQTLAPGETCTIDVRFAPASAGLFSDNFEIPSNDPDEDPVTVVINGTGIAVPVPEPDLTVTDSVVPNNDLHIPFGNVTVGSTSDQTVTITNDGSADLVIDRIEAPQVEPFSLQNDGCSAKILAPAASCTFVVRFIPGSTNTFNNSFAILSNDPDENPEKVDVDGIGTPIPVPDITVIDSVAPADDLQMPFGSLTEGMTAVQTVTVTNNGNANLQIGNVATANPLSAPFSIMNDNCSAQTLSATTVCTFDVRFAPTKDGISSDSFDIPSNDPDESSVTVDLSGTGLSSVTNNPPSKPRFISPANGQEVTMLDGGKVPLRWEGSTDPDGDTVSYDVYLCTDTDPIANCNADPVSATIMPGGDSVIYASVVPVSSFSGLNRDMALAGIAVVLMLLTVGWRGRKSWVLVTLLIITGSMVASCSDNDHDNDGVSANTVEYQATGLLVNTDYYWAVVAKDDQGGETVSDTWKFTTR